MWLIKSLVVPFVLLYGSYFVTGCIPRDTSSDTSSIAPTSAVEPNNDVATATAVSFNENGQARLLGTIVPLEEQADVDYYSLGAMNAGDHISVDVRTPQSDLDAVLAIFDKDNKLFILNDDNSNDDNYSVWIGNVQIVGGIQNRVIKSLSCEKRSNRKHEQYSYSNCGLSLNSPQV